LHNPFAPLIAIAQRGHSLSASHGPAPGPRPLAPVLPPTLAGVRIQLKYRHLRKAPRIIGLRDRPCDASCKKVPPDASQNPDPPTQPIEIEELKTS
jgi:hypothetical protein